MLKALETLDKYNASLSSMHNRMLHSKQTYTYIQLNTEENALEICTSVSR